MFTNAFIALWGRLQEASREGGQGLVEYALILVLVSVTLVVALGLLSDGIGDTFQEAIDAITPGGGGTT